VVQLGVVVAERKALAHRLKVDVLVVGTHDRERPLHTEVQRPLRHPARPVRDIDNLDRKRACPRL
jgi:hypothetical protein